MAYLSVMRLEPFCGWTTNQRTAKGHQTNKTLRQAQQDPSLMTTDMSSEISLKQEIIIIAIIFTVITTQRPTDYVCACGDNSELAISWPSQQKSMRGDNLSNVLQKCLELCPFGLHHFLHCRMQLVWLRITQPLVLQRHGGCRPLLGVVFKHWQKEVSKGISVDRVPLVLLNQDIEETPRLQLGDVTQLSYK